MSPWIGGAPTGSFWGQIARGSLEPAERLAGELARRAHRSGTGQRALAGRVSDDLVSMGSEAVPALIARLDTLGETGCTTLARIGPDAFAALVGQLQEGPPRRRCLAARALELTGFTAAAEPLRDASLDVDPMVRDAARHAIDGLARTWARRLRDGHVRDDASRALVAVGAQAVWPLAHVLHDRFIGLFAARILGQIGEPSVPAVVLVLAQARRSPDCEDWDPAFANATVALAAIGAPALDAVLRLLRDEHELANVRTGVVHVIARMGEIGVPHLVAALEDANPDVREAAASALARMSS